MSDTKYVKYFEPGTKGILFDDGKWLIWETNMGGHPLHGLVLMKHQSPKRMPVMFVFFTRDKGWLDIAIQSKDVCDPRVWKVIDKTIGYTADTTIQVETMGGEKFSGDMPKYFRRCGKDFESNPRRKRK